MTVIRIGSSRRLAGLHRSRSVTQWSRPCNLTPRPHLAIRTVFWYTTAIVPTRRAMPRRTDASPESRSAQRGTASSIHPLQHLPATPATRDHSTWELLHDCQPASSSPLAASGRLRRGATCVTVHHTARLRRIHSYDIHQAHPHEARRTEVRYLQQSLSFHSAHRSGARAATLAYSTDDRMNAVLW